MLAELATYKGRSIWQLVLPVLDAVPEWPKGPFHLIVCADRLPADRGALARFLESVFAAGARYVSCAGDSAEECHDAIDDFLVTEKVSGRNRFETEFGDIGTDWLTDKSIAEVLWNAFYATAWPDAPPTAPVVAVFLANDPRRHDFAAAARDPARSFADVLKTNESPSASRAPKRVK